MSAEANKVADEEFCPCCHNLDLRDPALQSDLSDEKIEAGLYLSWGEDSADFNIIGEDLQPESLRYPRYVFCALMSDLIRQLDPVLGVLRKWKNAEIWVGLEAGKNVEFYVNTQNIMPGNRYYELYSTHDVKYPFFSQGQPSEDLDSYPGSTTLWEQLRTWLSVCQKEHADCKTERLEWGPTRLIKVEKDRQYLVVVRDQPEEAATLEYIALSHCWGKEQPLRTLKNNLHDHLTDIPWHKLPSVFQDSVTAVRELGLKYIWIDSLCIVQDDRDDWARESRMMASVYEQACLTISATGCENGKISFLGSNASFSFRKPVTSKVAGLPEAMKFLRARRIPDSTKYEGPVMSRAWTLQERYFSQRIIHFTQYQTQWQCRGIQACESNPTLITRGGNRSRWTRKALNEWNQLLHEYSSLSLTKFSDKLPAISGLAARFQPRIDSKYLAGLWEIRLPEQLAWSMVKSETDSQTGVVEAAASLSENRPPSWTWASVTGLIFTWVPNVSKIYIDVAKIACEPSTSNAFGEVESGARLYVSCSLIDVEICHHPNETSARERYTLKSAGREGGTIGVFDADCLLTTKADSWAGRAGREEDLCDTPWSTRAVLMPLVAERDTPPGCLVLGKQAGFDNKTFQRLGFVPPMDHEPWEAMEPKKRTCSIVIM